MDISVLCRSCMQEIAPREREHFDTKYIEMFCYCTNIVITEEDKLPTQFCHECCIKIESSYTFITEAQKSNNTLKNIISRTQTSIIVKSEEPKCQLVDYEPKSNTSSFTISDYDISTINNFESRTLFENDHSHRLVLHDNFKSIEKTDKNNEIEVNSMDVAQTNFSETFEHFAKDEVCKPDDAISNELEPRSVQKTKEFVCHVCHKGFSFKAWLSRHIEKEHAENQFQCGQCNKSFAKHYLLKNHAISHSVERLFGCNLCGARFKRRQQLNAHARIHSDVRPYSCEQCGMRFKMKSILKSHMSRHTNQKPYLCSVCGWKFLAAANLEEHMRCHSGEKPHRCAECGFRSSTASSMARHRRRHDGRAIYVCTHCQKAFYDYSGLARHTRTHTGELPYKCPYCERAFLDSWKRKTHLMRQHKLSLADIPKMPRDPNKDLKEANVAVTT